MTQYIYSATLYKKGGDMALNIADSKYVYLQSDPILKPSYSSKVVFADLYSRQEGKFSHWKNVKFVGKAFDAALALQKGTAINILRGLIEEDSYISNKTGQRISNTQVVITEFELSNLKESEEDE